MSGHTKSPWKWNGHWLSGQGDSGIILWYTANDDGVHATPEDRNLIAAAPDLLGALETMLGKAYKQNWNDGYPEILDQAEAAIAKSRGES